MIFHFPTFDSVHGELIEGSTLDLANSFLRDNELPGGFIVGDLLFDEMVSP